MGYGYLIVVGLIKENNTIDGHCCGYKVLDCSDFSVYDLTLNEMARVNFRWLNKFSSDIIESGECTIENALVRLPIYKCGKLIGKNKYVKLNFLNKPVAFVESSIELVIVIDLISYNACVKYKNDIIHNETGLTDIDCIDNCMDLSINYKVPLVDVIGYFNDSIYSGCKAYGKYAYIDIEQLYGDGCVKLNIPDFVGDIEVKCLKDCFIYGRKIDVVFTSYSKGFKIVGGTNEEYVKSYLSFKISRNTCSSFINSLLWEIGKYNKISKIRGSQYEKPSVDGMSSAEIVETFKSKGIEVEFY